MIAMQHGGLHRTEHQELPQSDFYAWDGRRPEPLYREPRENYRRYVPDHWEYEVLGLKFGTSVISHGRMGRTRQVIRCIAEEVDYLLRNPEKRRRVYIVTSGAVGMGKKAVEANPRYRDLKMDGLGESDRKRLLAGIGQPDLTGLYREYFGERGIIFSQSLVTHADFADDRTRTELLAKYAQYMEDGIVPVINEDDLRSPEGMEDDNRIFRDNDGLFALLTIGLAGSDTYKGKMMAGILTDQRGIRPGAYFNGERGESVEDRVIRVVMDPAGLESQVAEEVDGKGRGWAWSKIDAMGSMASQGIPGFVAYGGYDRIHRKSHPFTPIRDAVEGLCVGTRFVPPQFW